MKEIVKPLLEWYFKEKRILPWRIDKNPYHVWISEIMLQQTRIEAVIGYYERFMKKVPTIQSLSQINDDELLKLWEGLGYYNRARNLKRAALKIMEDYDGVFPNTYEDILSLPGIGEYTAGAISSICFNLPEVAVDGNVMRVFLRIHNYDWNVGDLKIKKKIGMELKKFLPQESGDFNQAIMELGEVICIPNGIPKCDICPLKDFCKAYFHETQMMIPRKVEKKKKVEEEYTLLLMICNGKIALRKREDNLLKNMWEFPNYKGFLTYEEVDSLVSDCLSIKLGITYTHIFSHKKWFMNSYIVEISEETPEYNWTFIDNVESSYAIAAAFIPFFLYVKDEIKNNSQ